VKRAYAVLTVPRKTDYVHETIKSLETGGLFRDPENLPLHLVVACPDDHHLKPYFDDPRFMIHRLTPEETAVWTGLGIKARCAYGHHLAMKKMLGFPWDELLLLEDDARAAAGWMEHLEKIMPRLRQTERWILSLYYFIDDSIKKDFEAGRRIKRVDWEHFWGLQGVLYQRETVLGFCPLVLDVCVKGGLTPDDNKNGVGRFARDAGIPVFTTVPSLVEHIGRDSTGVTPYYHWARCFHDPVVDPAQP
jgi:hypothetical protein